MTEQITKNQHFVPQCLLKHFAGSDGLVSVYDSMRDILRPPSTVNRVLAENYLYDRDNVVEKFLATHVEAPAAVIIEELVSNPREFSTDSQLDILRFFAVQLNRTPSALSQTTEFVQKFTGTMFQRLGELNGFDEESIKGVKLVCTDTQALLARQTVEGALNWPLLEDLSWHILINETVQQFIISDHPVVHHNWFLRDSKDIAHTSLTSCGLQVFLPVSHSVTLCLFDNAIYKMGERGSNYSILKNVADVNILNNLQIRNRKSYVVFTNSAIGEEIKTRCSKLEPNSLHSSHAWSSAPESVDEENLKTTHAVWRTQIKLNSWLSVSRVHRRLRKKPIACYERKPEVVEAHKLFVGRARERSNAL